MGLVQRLIMHTQDPEAAADTRMDEELRAAKAEASRSRACFLSEKLLTGTSPPLSLRRGFVINGSQFMLACAVSLVADHVHVISRPPLTVIATVYRRYPLHLWL